VRTWPPLAISLSLTGAAWTPPPFSFPSAPCTLHGRSTTPVSENYTRKHATPAGSARISPGCFHECIAKARFFDSLHPSPFCALAFLLQSCGLDRPLVGQAHLLHHLLQAKGEPVSAGGVLRCRNNVQDIIPSHCNKPTCGLFRVPKRLVSARLAIADRHFVGGCSSSEKRICLLPTRPSCTFPTTAAIVSLP
jgi:hypothetical protein